MPERRIPIARPWMDDREAEAARRAILSGWVTQGPEVEAFEHEFAEAVGTRHACAVSSCTTALHLALRAVGVGPGDEVVTASHSYVATANAVRYCGATPVFADIERDGPNLDVDQVEASIGPLTRAILCVHQMGMPCDVRRLIEVAARHELPLIEDAACAIGSELRWSMEGGAERESFEWIGRPRGDIACFSFHPRKILTTGDGGMLTTRDPDLDRRFRRERQHGMDIPDTARHGAPRVLNERHVTLGYNYRMTDVQAAIGRVQLERLPEMLERRRFLASRYHALFAGTPIEPPRVPEWARPNWQSYWVRLPDDSDRQSLMQRMLDAGIATRRGIMCSHREPVYSVEPWKAGPGGLSRSERAQERTLLLPIFHTMTERDQDRVVESLLAGVAATGTRGAP